MIIRPAIEATKLCSASGSCVVRRKLVFTKFLLWILFKTLFLLVFILVNLLVLGETGSFFLKLRVVRQNPFSNNQHRIIEHLQLWVGLHHHPNGSKISSQTSS